MALSVWQIERERQKRRILYFLMVFHGQMIFVEGKNCAPDEKNRNVGKTEENFRFIQRSFLLEITFEKVVTEFQFKKLLS